MKHTLFYLYLLAACAGLAAPSPIHHDKRAPFRMAQKQVNQDKREALHHIKKPRGAVNALTPPRSTTRKMIPRGPIVAAAVQTGPSTVTVAPVIVTKVATKTAVATAYTTDVTVTTKVKTVTADGQKTGNQEAAASSKTTSKKPVSSSSSSPTPDPTPTDQQPTTTTTISTTEYPIPTGSEVVFSGGRGTWYYTGLGACGWTNYDYEYVVAVSDHLYDNFPGSTGPYDTTSNPVCGQLLDITYGGNTIRAAVVDRCVGCAVYDLDLAPSAFAALASLDQGELWGMTWKWA